MAKFAVALCILLVACGAQAGIVDSAQELIDGLIVQTITRIDKTLVKLEEYLIAALGKSDQYLAESITAIADIRENIRWRREVAASAAQDSSMCISEGAHYDDILKEIDSNVITCVIDAQFELQTDVNKSQKELKAFRSVITEFRAKVQECASNGLVAIEPCLLQVIIELWSKINEAESSLFLGAATILHETTSIDTLATCRNTNAYKVLVERSEEAYAAIDECLADTVQEA